MIAIILEILKWIGIILLTLLCILLILVCLVLFVPIRYSIRFRRTGLEEDPAIEVKGKVSWFLSLLRVLLLYPADVYAKGKVFLFTIFFIPDQRKKSKKKKLKEKKSKKNVGENTTNVLANDKTEESKEAFTKEENLNVSESNSTDQKTSLIEKIKKIPEIIQKTKDRMQAIKDNLETGRLKIDELCKKVEYYQKILESNIFRESFVLCKKELLGILKSISPDKIDVYLEIGLEDPATTANILSYYGMLYPWIYDKVRLVGNFQEIVMKTNGTIKGKIRLMTIVSAVIKVYFNKNIRKLIRIMKKGGTS